MMRRSERGARRGLPAEPKKTNKTKMNWKDSGAGMDNPLASVKIPPTTYLDPSFHHVTILAVSEQNGYVEHGKPTDLAFEYYL